MVDGDLTAFVVGRAQRAAVDGQQEQERARQCLLDWFGVILAADRQMLSPTLGTANVGGATELRTGRRTLAASAAQANAAYAHQLDFDDFHVGVPGHASAPVIGAALAVAESVDASLGELLAAVIAGVEAVVTLGTSYGESLFARGWHPTAVLGSIGAAVASAQILDGSRGLMRDAIGLASLQTSGTMAGFGNVGKSWQVGCAARNGVEAAVQARGKSWDLPDFLSGTSGALRLMTGIDEPRLTTDERLAIGNTQFKYYATCFGTHAAIRAAEGVRRSGEFSPQQIASVEVAIGREFEHVVINPAPTTLLQAKFSASATVALSLLDAPPVVPEFFSEEVAKDPLYVALEARTSVRASDDIAGGGARVVVTTRDGDVYEQLERESRARSANDEWPAIEQKFLTLTRNELPQADRVHRMVREGDVTLPVSDIVGAFSEQARANRSK